MIEFSNAVVEYGDFRAVGPVDLVVPSGETTVLIGSSGCGKSTMIRMVVGLALPTAGSVDIDGETVTATNAPALRRKIGYVIQEGGLFPHLTARENLALLDQVKKRPAAKTAARIDELCALTHLSSEFLDRYPAQLSGGQRQRVALMRALMQDPDILLLDEPLGALDPVIRHELQTDLRQIFRDLGKTVLMVTHDIAEAGYFADTLVLLRDGHIVQQGALSKLLNAPSDPFVTQFVSSHRDMADIAGDLT